MSPRMIRGGVVAAILLVVLGAAFATPWVFTLQLPAFGPAQPPPLDIPPVTLPPQQPDQTDPAMSHLLEQILIGLLTVLACTVVAYLLYRMIQRLRAAWRPDDKPVEAGQLGTGDILGEVVEVDIASLATAVARAEAHLAGLAEPRDAVTAAWVALEDEAALQGTVRNPAQTATEFTTELLRHSPAPAEAVSVLRRLYHRARFTAHPVTVGDVAHARDALGRIAAALDAAIPVVPAEPNP